MFLIFFLDADSRREIDMLLDPLKDVESNSSVFFLALFSKKIFHICNSIMKQPLYKHPLHPWFLSVAGMCQAIQVATMATMATTVTIVTMATMATTTAMSMATQRCEVGMDGDAGDGNGLPR